MIEDNKNKIRQWAIYAFVVIVGLLVLNQIYIHLTTASIAITTQDTNSIIKVMAAGSSLDGSPIAASSAGDKKLHVRLKSGSYQISVVGKTSYIGRTITAHARHGQKIALTSPRVVGA